MTLQMRFLQLTALVIVSISFIAAVSGYELNAIVRHVAVVEEADDMALEFAQLRHKGLEYIFTKNPTYLTEFEELYTTTSADLKHVIALSEENAIDSSELKVMQSKLQMFYQSFNEFDQLQQEIGMTPKDGIYGSLRNAVHDAEDKVKKAGMTELYKEMLLLRRYEKDFMLRLDEKYVDKFNKQTEVFNQALELVPDEGVYRSIKSAMSVYYSNFNKLVNAEKRKGITADSGLRKNLIAVEKDAENSGLVARDSIKKNINEAIDAAIYQALGIMAALAALIVFSLLWVSKGVSTSVLKFKNEVRDFVSDLKQGNADLNKKIAVTGFKEIEDLSSDFNNFTSVLASQTEQTELLAKTSEVVKQAFDNASTPAMIVDLNGKVSYINRSMYDFIQLNKSSFSVDSNNLRDFPLTDLCRSEKAFIQSIASIDQSQLKRIEQDGLTIDWQVTPIMDESRHVSSHIIEWDDQTEQLKTELEVESMITAAKNGDFTQQISLQGKSGFFLQVSEGLNAVVESVDTSLSDVSSVLTDIANGSLDNSLQESYSGKLAELATATNSMVIQLKEVIEDISTTVMAAKRGQFDMQISEDNKQGFYLSIAQGLNEQGNVIDSAMMDVGQVLRSISEGDLSAKVTQQYEGRIHELSEYTNTMGSKLNDVVGKISELVENAARGDFNTRIDAESQQGFYRKLSEHLNRLNSSTESAMAELMQTLSSMADGDLTNTVDQQYEGIFDELKKDANTTIANLENVITDIQRGAASVKDAAKEISQGNLDLSRRTEQQAASLEETASSMEEMTATIIQNTESSKNASVLASNTRQVAEDGGQVVDQAISAMGAISDSSSKIADIISVIDEIAFQTNLLALNASVEAARAGEQGRGFAVVAGEVRNLAGRSATAAKEIKDLIEDSVKKVDEGKSLVNRSGESLTNIVGAVKEVSDLVAEIATASEEQSQGISEVNRAVTKMDEMTQQNAALVEEVASTSDALGTQAADLESKIGFFKTSGMSAAAAGMATAAQAPMESSSAPDSFDMADAAPTKGSSRRNTQHVKPSSTNEDWTEF